MASDSHLLSLQAMHNLHQKHNQMKYILVILSALFCGKADNLSAQSVTTSYNEAVEVAKD